jgi:hexosaminidase
MLALHVGVADDGSPPQKGVDESFTLILGPASATIKAPTVFGAMYGLESFSQMVSSTGILPCSHLLIQDKPQFIHRGIMLDTGRRHYPIKLIKTIVDGMVPSKLNVLHLHLSDFGGYRVQSASYPALTAKLVDTAGERLYWTVEEVGEIVDYAADRGVRIVPEVDLPGHAAALFPLVSNTGVQFCTEYNATVGLLHGYRFG